MNHPAIPTERKSLFLFDRYEVEERRALQQVLDPELPVVELGGSIGVVACITNTAPASRCCTAPWRTEGGRSTSTWTTS